MNLQDEAREAICSALYQMPFCENLGEERSILVDGGRTIWWHLGESPADMRVGVSTHPTGTQEVVVSAEWYLSDRKTKGSQHIRIPTAMAQDKQDLLKPSEDAVIRVLEIFQDVLGGTGVASPVGAVQ